MVRTPVQKGPIWGKDVTFSETKVAENASSCLRVNLEVHLCNAN